MCYCAMHKVGYQSIAATWQNIPIGNQSHAILTHTILPIYQDKQKRDAEGNSIRI